MGEFFERIRLVWDKVNPVQRALLIAVVLTAASGTALILYWARRPDMRMLYQSMAPEDAAKIVDKIAEKNIPYELRGAGTSIYVPQEHVYQLRLEMAKEGLLSGQQTGFKLFDKEKIGTSPFVQNVNLKRALQDELAKSVQMIEGVSYARVHIDNPEQGVFGMQNDRTRASVVIRLRPGYRLSSANIAAVTNLVAGSIAGLEPDKVTVVDTQGTLLSSQTDHRITAAAGTYHDYKMQVESNLSKKVEDMLATILGPGRAKVLVSAELDMKQQSTITETPTAGVEKTIEEDTQKDDDPGTLAADGKTTVPGRKSSTTRTTTEMATGRTVLQEANVPGVVTALSVSAAVDLRPADPNATGLVMPIEDVKLLISNALGLKEDRDEIQVSNIPFYQPPREDVLEGTDWVRYMALARQGSMGVMAVCALLVLKIFAGAKKKAAGAPVEALPALGPGAETGMLPAAEDTRRPNSTTLQRQVASALQSNPDQVRQLFANWIEQG
jgi:flagellar M-ring protein FliF